MDGNMRILPEFLPILSIVVLTIKKLLELLHSNSVLNPAWVKSWISNCM